MKNKITLTLIVLALIVGLIIGAALNERKKKSCIDANKLKKCNQFAENVVLKYDVGDINNESSVINIVNRTKKYLSLARTYYVCVQEAYGFEEK